MKELEEQKRLFQALQAKKKESDGENQVRTCHKSLRFSRIEYDTNLSISVQFHWPLHQTDCYLCLYNGKILFCLLKCITLLQSSCLPEQATE